MPDGATLVLFAVAAISVNLTPGPDMLYVIARSLGVGRWAGIVSALGLSVGYVVHTGLAASGLAALLLSAPAAYRAIRVIGAAYLVFLGLRALRTQPDQATALPSHHPPAATQAALRWPEIFRQGALTSTLNPSIVVFFLAFLPQFVAPARGPVFSQVIVLGLLFNLTATLTHTVIALLAGTAGQFIRGRSGSGRWLRGFSGAILILLGARVLLGGT